MKMNGILTRRDFLGASVLAFQGVLLMPDAAHADQANASVLELDGSIEAREMWAEAVKIESPHSIGQDYIVQLRV